MILFGAESFEADEPEGSAQRGSQYMSRKDARFILLAIVVFTLISIPAYQYYKRQGEKSICSNNMRAIAQAILTYSTDNDDRLPIAFYPDEAGNPVLEQGLPITWATLVEGGKSERASFRCPSANPQEVTRVTPFVSKKPIELTYGMFAGASGRTERGYDRPTESVLLAETSNNGALNTYNPLSFGEKFENDGFLIGLDVSNAQGAALKDALDFIRADIQRGAGDPDKQGLKEPNFVTRLAFPESAKGKFDSTTGMRHDNGIHAIYVDGRLGLLKPGAARVDYSSASSSRHRWIVP